MNDPKQVSEDLLRNLTHQVAAILYAEDTMGINFGDNTDEYEPEAETIVARLNGVSSLADVESVVYEEFCAWFGDGNVGAKKIYEPAAARIWDAWCRVREATA